MPDLRRFDFLPGIYLFGPILGEMFEGGRKRLYSFQGEISLKNEKATCFTVLGRPRPWYRPGERIIQDKATGTAQYKRFDASKDTKAEISTLARIAHSGGPWADPVSLTILFVYPWTKAHKKLEFLRRPFWFISRPDIDNLEKLIADGIQKIVINDDSQICEVRKRKVYGETARTTVEIRPLQEPPPGPIYSFIPLKGENTQ